MFGKEHVVVTIDGPAGSGKSSVASRIARALGFMHLNSGALYRAIALKALERSIDFSDQAALRALALHTCFEFGLEEDGSTTLTVDGLNLDSELSAERVGEGASVVGLVPAVRDALTEVQRAQLESFSLVLEGRDAGSVVFPDAEFKFYLDADLRTRALRRYNQLLTARIEATLEDIERDIALRDHRDQTREIAPGHVPKGAILIDTSSLSIEQTVDRICAVVQGKMSR